MWYNSFFQTICMNILDMNSACLHLVVDSSSFWLQSLWWVISEFSHSWLSSWIKLFSAFLNFHKILCCFLSIFWWLFSDCLCSMWCIHHVLISWSFYILHALSLQFSSLMFETFLKLFEFLNSLCEVQCFRFQACKVTLLDFVVSSICLQFLERSNQLISFVSFSSFFSLLFSLKSYVSCKAMINYLWIVAFSLLLLLLLHWFMMMF